MKQHFIVIQHLVTPIITDQFDAYIQGYPLLYIFQVFTTDIRSPLKCNEISQGSKVGLQQVRLSLTQEAPRMPIFQIYVTLIFVN